MATIKRFRVGGHWVEKDEPEFWFKLNTDDNIQLMNLCICEDGIYYYRARSQILSPKEKQETRDSYDGYLSMEKVQNLFENLRKIGWSRKEEETQEIMIKVEKRKIIIEIVEEE